MVAQPPHFSPLKSDQELLQCVPGARAHAQTLQMNGWMDEFREVGNIEHHNDPISIYYFHDYNNK